MPRDSGSATAADASCVARCEGTIPGARVTGSAAPKRQQERADTDLTGMTAGATQRAQAVFIEAPGPAHLGTAARIGAA